MAHNDLFGALGDALKQVAPEDLARVNEARQEGCAQNADQNDSAASKSNANASSPLDALNAAARSLNLENGLDLESLAKFLPKGLDLAAIKSVVEKMDLDALQGFLPKGLDPQALKSALAAFSGGNAPASANQPERRADNPADEADSPLETLAKGVASAFFGK